MFITSSLIFANLVPDRAESKFRLEKRIKDLVEESILKTSIKSLN